MTPPEPPSETYALEGSLWCSEPGCDRPPLYSSHLCRVHRVFELRGEGRNVAFPEPFDAVEAATIHFLQLFRVLSRQRVSSEAPSMEVEVTAVLAGAVDRKAAYLVTDIFSTELADRFGMASLDPPEDREGDTLLRFRTLLPGPALMAPRIRAAMAGVMIEIFGAEALKEVVAGPTSHRDG